ncbi:uncharacterized protein N0V89_012523 [Didymosphaeria variabile]|uniref:3'-5' exonuclease domain-containing protein n=1 Tax=Didymosphaeria variabile TaxID=1932322 RepID=A0A9W8X9B8_9PLEO|nr:uncharacterized protein N0V89_012523 [Didymosphaeria variabile]KAJ4344779.1 hypothetical protein N0V89_012523 [Didymosphaeria variabile]
MVNLPTRIRQRKRMRARMQKYLAQRLLPRSARPSDMDHDDYAVEWDTVTDSPKVRGARLFTERVDDMAKEIMYLGDDIHDAIQRSIADLTTLRAGPETSGAATPTTSQSVAARMAMLTSLKVTRLQTAKLRATLVKLCHFYRALLRHASGVPNDVSPTIHALRRERFLLHYKCAVARGLSEELSRDVRGMALDAIPGFVARLRIQAVHLAKEISIATHYIKIGSTRLYGLKLAEAGGEGLGSNHAFLFWNSHQFEFRLKDLRALRLQLRAEALFPLSTQYSTSMTNMFRDIDTRIWRFNDNASAIENSFKDLRRQIERNAIMAGRSGALEPFAITIRKQLVESLKAKYREDNPGLRRWGYQHTRWYMRIRYISLAQPQDVSRQSVRRKHRSERQKHIRKLSSPLHVRYFITSSGWAKPRTRKHKPIRNVRKQLQVRRRTALGKLRRLLSATLLSYQSRTFKSMRSADRLASLPKKEKPSSVTQVGMTIAALGFYKKTDEENNNIKTNYSRKVEPLTNKSGRPLVRWKEAQGKPMRVLPQFRPRFTATQPMRAPHPTSISFSSDAWAQSVDVLTIPDASGRRSLVSECSTSSPGGRTSDDKSDIEHSRNDSKGEHQPKHPEHPEHQPDGQNTQSPNENMDKLSKNDPPSESEHDDESESEFDEDSEIEEPVEEHTPLTYQIPPDVLYNALQAPTQTRGSYWSQKLYRSPEDKELLLHYCVNMEVSERVAKHFLNEKVVGFDIEWKPFGYVDSIKENASLIQLATEDRIALFHIARFPGRTPEQLMPPTLKAVLESAETFKVGVAVKGDCSRLEKYFGMNIHGVFELSRLHNLVEYYKTEPSKVNNKLVKLATQVHQHLLLPLHKGEPFVDEPLRLSSVRESDWSRPLDYEQIHYAAADAYAGFRLFDVMESKRKKLKPTPPIPRLCDYDNKPAPRTTPKAKRAKKATPDTEKIVAGSLSGLEAEDAEEEAYETAAEELAEEEEDEDADSESASESSEDEDPDADYAPKVRGRIALGQGSSDPSTASEVPAHHIGRADISSLTGLDPRYPELPSLSAAEESTSEESEAFDPPPKAPRRRRVAKPAQEAKVLLAKAEESEDEFPDPELEEAFATMVLDEPSKTASNPATEAAPEVDETNSALDMDPLQIEEEPSQPSLSTTAPTPTFTPLIQPDPTAHTPEFTLATTWAQNYLISTIPSPSSTVSPRIRATVPPLRAYHLWHHQRVPLDAIGAHLRDPPLAQSTVSSYIIQAINMEKLEYRDEDLINLMGTLPANLKLGRYGWLSRKLGIVR